MRSAIRRPGRWGLLHDAAVFRRPTLPADPVDTGGDVMGTWTAVSFGGNPVPISEYVQDPDAGHLPPGAAGRGPDVLPAAVSTPGWRRSSWTAASPARRRPDEHVHRARGAWTASTCTCRTARRTGGAGVHVHRDRPEQLSMRVKFGGMQLRSRVPAQPPERYPAGGWAGSEPQPPPQLIHPAAARPHPSRSPRARAAPGPRLLPAAWQCRRCPSSSRRRDRARRGRGHRRDRR